MERRTAAIILAIFVLVFLANVFSAGISAQNENSQGAKAQKIFLKSREFVPSEKIPAQAENKISEVSQKKGKAHVLIQLDHLPDEEEKQQLD